MKTDHLTIGQRTFLGFGFLCLLCAVISGCAIERLLALKQQVDAIAKDALPGVIAIGQAKAGLAENQIRMNRLLRIDSAQQRQALLDVARKTTETNSAAIKRYEAAIFTPEDRRNYEEFTQRRATFQKARASYLTALETNKLEAQKILDGPLCEAYEIYQDAGEILARYNVQEAGQITETLLTLVRRTMLLLLVVAGVGLAVGIASGIVVVRSIVRVLKQVSQSLEEGADQVAAAAGQVSSSSQSLAEGASQQAASLEESSASLEEMASMTQRNAENAQRANELAQQTRAAAETGSADMEAMSRAMMAIHTSSDEIAKIIKTIDEIAFQTNILALNAAVEAARAGEAGMGFAVVADEVRNLAQRCAQSARETSGKIESAVANTAQGVALSTKVAEGLRAIVSKVRQVADLAAEVAAASREQSQGVSQVNLAVTEMDKVTQANAANAEESSAAAEELNAQAETLTDAMTELLRLVGGQAAAHRPGRPSSKSRTPGVPSRMRTGSAAPQIGPAHHGTNGYTAHSGNGNGGFKSLRSLRSANGAEPRLAVGSGIGLDQPKPAQRIP